jgi:homoserine dehydrogenase
MSNKAMNLVLVGFGLVGREFYRLLDEKADRIEARYGLDVSIRAILNSRGGVLSERPITSESWQGNAIEVLAGHLSWRQGLDLATALQAIEPGAVVECTPSNLKTGEPALSHVRLALDNGWHVVTANKGPLVVDFKGLKQKAADKGLALEFSAAAGAALPGLDVGLYSLAGAEITAIEGILNGTTNFILTQMDQGIRYEDALQEAKAKGIAEPDPSQDVEGWDTAVKILLLANAMLGLDLTLGDIDVQGITDIPDGLRNAAKAEGKVLKLLGKIHQAGSQFKAQVKLTAIDSAHPLFGVNGTNKGITFFTDTMGLVTVTGGKSDPRGAAAAVLKDIINIFRRTRTMNIS